MNPSFRTASVTHSTANVITSDQIHIGPYSELGLEFSTFASGGTHYLLASSDGSTFRRVGVTNVDGSVADFEIAPSNSGFVQCPVVVGAQYLKVSNTTGVTGGITYKFYYR